MKKGDILLIPFPFSDLTTLKTRPALVLISTTFDVTVAFITSKVIKQEPDDLEITPDKQNGLKVDSLVKLNKLATIDKGLALGKLGSLTASELKQIDMKLLSVFAIRI